MIAVVEGPHPLRYETSPPEGVYGVWAEARHHQNNPQWISKEGQFFKGTYDEAIILADEMCRCNRAWHYYAKPLPL